MTLMTKFLRLKLLSQINSDSEIMYVESKKKKIKYVFTSKKKKKEIMYVQYIINSQAYLP